MAYTGSINLHNLCVGTISITCKMHTTYRYTFRCAIHPKCDTIQTSVVRRLQSGHISRSNLVARVEEKMELY